MNSGLEALAAEKENLKAQSALCRLKLRRQLRGVHDSLPLAGFSRAGRMTLIAARIIVYVKFASSVISCVRGLRSAISSSDRAKAGRIPS